MTVDRWIEKINSIGLLYDWDDKAKIFCAIVCLTGNAKAWYECQTVTPETWEEWEVKLKLAFLPYKGIAAKSKEFVNNERKSDHDVISFYYEKLRLWKHRNLSDTVIVDMIIFKIYNDIFKVSARAANCRTTDKLLYFLVDSDYINTRRD